VDPLARDDGETEPELELAEEPRDGAASASARSGEIRGEEPEITAESAPDPDIGGAGPEPAGGAEAIHPVRARLLARAAASRARVGPRSTSDRSASLGLDGELDAPAGAPAPSAPVAGAPISLRGRPPLSPNMVALFGTLLGLALVASIIALVMRIHTPDKAAATQPVATAPTPNAPAPDEPSKRQRVKQPGPWRIADAKSDPAARVIEGKVGTNPFLKAVEDAGIAKKEAYRAFNALKDLKNLDKCSRTDTFYALLDRGSGRLRAFEYVVNKEEVYQAREGQNGELTATRLDFKVERRQVRAALVVTGSDLDAAAEKAGLERGVALVMARALDGHMSVDELERGDVVRLVLQEVTVLGEFSRYAGVEALEIRRADDKEKPWRLYYFRGQKERGYYDEKGRSPYEGGWRKPIKDAPITSHFNPKRMHPVLHKIMPHTGTDFGAPMGTPVGASSYGTVSFIGPAGPSGNLVKVDHPGGIETGYAHLSRFAEGLKVGDKVKRLQILGYVGSTGRSTGPHLHFTAKKNGEFFDAETLNLDGMRVLSKDERDAFAKVKQQYDEALDSIALPAPLPAENVAAPTGTVAEPAPVDDEFASGGGEPAPAGSSAASSPPPAAPAGHGGNPVYLTDKELQKSQSASDEGEVEE
jgi:murein DD-endopeptidase MepM/ murein hydrolase activator NlpD